MKLLALLILLSACGPRQKKAPGPARKIFNTHRSSSPIFLTHQRLECAAELNLDFPVYADEVLQLDAGRLTVISPKRPLKLCEDAEYLPETIEGAGYSASLYAGKARKSYETATGLKLAPLKIVIAPEIRQDGKFLTDNAFYWDEEQSIVFLPHSLEARAGGINYNYWSVPMIPAHEYGHHIFSRFLSTSPYPIILNAFSEGFADLVAYYALDGNERDLTGLKCLEDSRTPEQEKFYDGSPKSITKDNLEIFLAQAEGPFIDCEKTDFRDIHVVGAAFASFAHQLLVSVRDTDDERLRVLHSWLTEIRSQESRLMPLSKTAYFEELYLIFIDVAVKNWSTHTCGIIQRSYPALFTKIPSCVN